MQDRGDSHALYIYAPATMYAVIARVSRAVLLLLCPPIADDSLSVNRRLGVLVSVYVIDQGPDVIRSGNSGRSHS
jgi:hypothetical protein